MSDEVERSKAREFIDKLRLKRSGGSEAERQQIIRTLPKLGPSLLEGYDEARRDLGSAVILLSQDLNTKPTHFVYELIQNADDNEYELSDEVPFLRLVVTPHRITIDSNEDGFSYENVDALCSVGKSTKKGRSGYIGEKGIGFKSVFKVARRATILSGPFSFYFEHDENAIPSGIGMITPHNVYDDLQGNLPAGVRTRIILDLRTQCDMEQFKKLPPLLLFLEKLQKLSIRVEYENSRVEEVQHRISKTEDYAELTELHDGKETKRRFHLTLQQARGMPSDHRRQHKQEANILLAFPVDEMGHPAQSREYVYAFLPLFPIGFPFLVQSDFITSTNRENVDHCPWNFHLLREIARVFIEKVTDLRKLPSLEYKWVRYAPINQVTDEFWQILQDHIQDELREAKIFETMDGYLKTPASLRKVTAIYRDQYKNPLLPDLDNNEDAYSAYLSDEYGDEDIEVLEHLGIETLSPEEFVVRLEVNLEGPVPRIDEESGSSEWQRLCAKTLLSLTANKAILEKLKTLRLIPLINGGRICSLNNDIVHPQCGGIPVPEDLELNIISQLAFDVVERKRLFVKLGAYECDPATVLLLIEGAYLIKKLDTWRQSFWPKHVAHLRFCFWHHKDIPKGGLKLRFAYFSKGKCFDFAPEMNNRWIYSHRTDYTNAPAKIFGEEFRAQLDTDIIFLPERYDKNLEDLAPRNGKNAVTWLEQLLEVKKYIQPNKRRTAFEEAVPSHELELVAKHRPNILLSVLQPYGNRFAANSKWQQILSAMKVPTLHSTSHMTLGNTTIPRPVLVNKIKELRLEQDFGFVQELDSLRDDQYASWSFLEKFGLKHEASLQFWFYVMKHACTQKAPISTYVKLFYELQAFAGKRDEIRTFLNSAPMIPWNNKWYLLRDCIWATDDVQIPNKASIASQFAQMQFFFVTILELRPPSLGMHIQALIQASTSDTRNKDDILHLMLNVCALKPGRAEVTQLLNCSIFPIQTPDGRLVWKSAVDSFGILDRLEHQRAFASQFDHLDLTIEEFHKVKILLLALGLEPRLSSRTVSESTAVEGGRPNLAMTSNLQAKAYAVCRFLADGQSSRCSTIAETKSLLKELEEAQMHESNSISKLLSVKIDDKVYSVPSDQASCHVAMADGKLILYLPSDPSLHHTFLADELPQKLLEHFGAMQGDYILKLGHVMTAVSLDAVDRLLDRYGIIKYPGIERPTNIGFTFRMTAPGQTSSPLTTETSLPGAAVRPGHSPSTFGSYTPFTSPAVASSGSPRFNGSRSAGSVNELSDAVNNLAIGVDPPSQSATRVSTPITGSSQGDKSTSSSPPEAMSSSIFDFTGPGGSTSASPNPSTRQRPYIFGTLDPGEAYKQLLEYIVRVSRLPDDFTLPRMGESSMGTARLASGVSVDLACSKPFEHKQDPSQVGAAGELMVFEILSRLGLHQFSRDNWQSRIRTRVSVHDDYKDLGRHPSLVEIADIVYYDRHNELFKILKAQGHFNSEDTPTDSYTFQIEVKTSTSNLDAEFFVSQNQVNLMNNTRTGNLFGQSRICYVIARVFNLGRQDMGLALFVNPAKLRDDGMLVFTTSYKVRPGIRWAATRP